MARRETLCSIAMAAVAVISFSNLLGVTAAGAAVFIGVVMFFVNKAAGKEPFAGSGLDVRAMGANLSDKSIWVWIALPLVMDGVSLALARAFLPGYIDHVLARTALFVSLAGRRYSFRSWRSWRWERRLRGGRSSNDRPKRDCRWPW